MDTVVSLNQAVQDAWGPGFTGDILLATDDTFGDVVVVGGNSKLGFHAISGSSITDETPTDLATVFSTSISAISFDNFGGRSLYLVGSGDSSAPAFAKLSAASLTFTDLTSKIPGGWTTLTAVSVESTSGTVIVFVGDDSGHFGKYVPGTDTFTDLTANLPPSVTNFSQPIQDAWGPSFSGRITIAGQLGGDVFIVGGTSKLGEFNPTGGTITDQTTVFSFDGSLFDSIDGFCTAIDPSASPNRKWWFAGQNSGTPKFAVFDFNAGTFTNKSSLLPVTWTSAIICMAVSSDHRVYIGDGSGHHFGYYDPGTDTFTDLSVTLVATVAGMDVTSITEVTAGTNPGIYLSDSAGLHLIKYKASDDSMLDLSVDVAFGFDAEQANGDTLFGIKTAHSFGKLDTSGLGFTDLSGAISAVLGNTNWTAMAVNPFANTVYVAAEQAGLAKFVIGTGNADGTFSGIWGDGTTFPIRSLFFNSSNQKLYIGGGSGRFAELDPAKSLFADGITDIHFAHNDFVYVGNGSHWGRLNPSNDTFNDATDHGAFSLARTVGPMTPDGFVSRIFGVNNVSNDFARTDGSMNNFTPKNAKVPFINGDLKIALAVDPAFPSVPTLARVFIGCGNGAFGSYNILTDDGTEDTSLINSFFAVAFKSILFNPTDKKIYFGGAGGPMGVLTPAPIGPSNAVKSGAFMCAA